MTESIKCGHFYRRAYFLSRATGKQRGQFPTATVKPIWWHLGNMMMLCLKAALLCSCILARRHSTPCSHNILHYNASIPDRDEALAGKIRTATAIRSEESSGLDSVRSV
ncbi:hypothetical protein PoB_003185500 [Plakobranchus ocellatus]|uniref:Uncharacterized protein n=1 Tax=Plakobranchus ocellatus TaxID=259542 RepID=A0AAV4AAZ1_9GAST|nr:hypothetical protein PoB_003185500 [Plakobranchus ocellatus]